MNSQESKCAPFPVKKSDLKPRMDKHTCQYCGYTSRNCNDVDDHVNTQHEMQEWFKCKICKYVNLNHKKMRLHLNRCHKLKVDGMEAKKLVITNPKEILKHKKAMMKKSLKIKISKKPEFMPIDKDNFKPRKDPKICQYCDYRSRSKTDMDEHVNACHEMIHWYQCNHCSHAALDKYALRFHFLTVHNLNLTSRTINDLIIKDPTKIDHLKKEKIQKKKDKDDFSKMPPEQLRKDPKFMPIDHADFKPRDHLLICQYCGFSSKEKQSIDSHVNSNHELTTWFKCSECDFATLFCYSLKCHLKDQHLRRNVKWRRS